MQVVLYVKEAYNQNECLGVYKNIYVPIFDVRK